MELTIAEETSEGTGPLVDHAGPLVAGGSPRNEFVLDRLRGPLLLLSFAESAEEEVEMCLTDIVARTVLELATGGPYTLFRVLGNYYILNYWQRG